MAIVVPRVAAPVSHEIRLGKGSDMKLKLVVLVAPVGVGVGAVAVASGWIGPSTAGSAQFLASNAPLGGDGQAPDLTAGDVTVSR